MRMYSFYFYIRGGWKSLPFSELVREIPSCIYLPGYSYTLLRVVLISSPFDFGITSWWSTGDLTGFNFLIVLINNTSYMSLILRLYRFYVLFLPCWWNLLFKTVQGYFNLDMDGIAGHYRDVDIVDVTPYFSYKSLP